MKIAKAKQWILEHQFLTFVVSVLAVATVLTGVSLWLYNASGTARLDLSRPGYEKVRSEVKDEDSKTEPFSSTGPIDSQSVKDFRARYEALKKKLDKTGNYDESAISDDNLGLNPVPEVSEPVEQ